MTSLHPMASWDDRTRYRPSAVLDNADDPEVVGGTVDSTPASETLATDGLAIVETLHDLSAKHSESMYATPTAT